MKFFFIIFISALFFSFFAEAQDDSFFEPFKISTNKKLIRKYNVVGATRFYHEWIVKKELPTDCSELIGSCDYYLCREMQKSCRADGYFLSFGYQYCSESVINLSKKLSPQGQEWIKSVVSCLQRKMDSFPNSKSCTQMRIAAIESHDECYSESKFCDLDAKDIFYIIDMISPELSDWRVLREGLEVLRNCK